MASDARKKTLVSRLLDVACALVAYVGARLIWGRRETLDALHLELVTFVLLYLMLQAIVRGGRLVRLGRSP